MMNVEELKDLFKLYKFDLLEFKEDQYAVFSLGSSMYPAVEIINFDNCSKTINTLKDNYGRSGYAVHVCEANSRTELESYLFNLFFQVCETNRRISLRYEDYVRNVMQAYGYDNSKDYSSYKFVNIPFQVEHQFEPVPYSGNIVNSIIDDLKRDGSKLIIVEARAGFGKTSTAIEVLNKFSTITKDIRPFFMELAKDRSAVTFRYLLLSQIDRSFNVKLDSELVIYNIKRGRIPLIIDGFDELLSRDIDNGQTETDHKKVETMLSTIADLLTDQAKVVLTTRKTAIFAGENFANWYYQYSEGGVKFDIIRYQLDNPSISDWLPSSRIKMLPENFENIDNPVILGYLRYMDEESFVNEINDSSLTKTYFDKLLRREKDRQDLPFTISEQKTILSRLAAWYGGLNVSALKRKEVKETVMELCDEILLQNETPAKDKIQLSNTLSNHAFLDRKGEQGIGFLNDFIFGSFLMLSIINENDDFYSDIFKELSYSSIEKALMAASVRDRSVKNTFWERLHKCCHLEPIQDFWSDLILRGSPQRDYQGISLDDQTVRECTIGDPKAKVKNCTFSNIRFINCLFSFDDIIDCSFINCTFKRCDKDGSNFECGFYGCNDKDNDFIDKYEAEDHEPKDQKESDIVMEILKSYFQVDERTPRMRMISKIKDKYDTKQFKKAFAYLTSKGYLLSNGDKSHISQDGIDYYNKKKQ